MIRLVDRFSRRVGWAIRLVVPFTFQGHTFAAGGWIVQSVSPRLRLAMTDAHFREVYGKQTDEADAA